MDNTLNNSTPTERLILMALNLNATLTAANLRLAVGARSPYQFRQALRTLVLAGAVSQEGEVAATATYAITVGNEVSR